MLLLIAVLLSALQQAPPPTEIYLAPLTKDGDALKVGAALNISNSPGYDNQPFFTRDGASILFTSARGGSSATDIYRYDIATRRVVRITDTPESEYSPTIRPDGQHISVIRVEADGTQRLWQFTLDGQRPALLLADVKPVGYHAWMDDRTLALFVLGQPPTLQVADTRTGKATTVVSGIGRSIQKMPDGAISFVRRESPDGKSAVFTIVKLARTAAGTFDTSVLVAPPAPAADPDMAWTPDGLLLVASGGRLFGWRPAFPGWKPLADLNALGLQNVSRLAVSPKGDFLAIVAQPK